MELIVIYPGNFINAKTVDIDYEGEQRKAQKLGIVTVTCNYDAFISGEKIKLYGADTSELSGLAIYRGWMLKPDQYKRFYSELGMLGIQLITTPTEYYNTHCLPNSYNNIMDYTPNTIWFPDGVDIDYNKIRSSFDKFIVRDYCKTVMGLKFPDYLESSMSNIELAEYFKKFKQLRGSLYTGGLVLKQYVDIEKDSECRVFYINKHTALAYNKTIDLEVPEGIINLASKQSLRNLKSHFYTIDFAKLTSGEYIVVEIGDGQVSGLKSDAEAAILYTELKKLLIH